MLTTLCYIIAFCTIAEGYYFDSARSYLFTLLTLKLCKSMSHGRMTYSVTDDLSTEAYSGRSGVSNDQIRCRHKGVVPHQNGHWGAQIYANHQRIWLGTFKTEIEAAKAYDRAAVKLRSYDSYRNIYLSRRQASLEAEFQRRISMEDVLSMIKEGSYESHLVEFKRSLHHPTRIEKPETTVATKLFEKALTPSDVGKLNRLVIPKKSALKFQRWMSEDGGSEDENEVEVEFFDTEMKCWKFRFCYWKSSQSFVFTKGWSKFVKGKRLTASDVVVFHLCKRRGESVDTPFFTVDVRKRVLIDAPPRQNICEVNDEEEVQEMEKRFTFRLFGVEISGVN